MKKRDLLFFFLLGAVFSWALGFSGMLFPEKILAFLNLTDFSLMFVMGGAVATYFVFYLFARRKAGIRLPEAKPIDGRLLLGAALFGIGWGLSGLCPGPAVAAIGSLTSSAWIFLGAMVVGGLTAAKISA